MKRWWVSWYETDLTGFEYHGPWWISGVRMSDDAESVCAAVTAETEEDAKEIIASSYDFSRGYADLEWRFVNLRDDDWEPFCDRFERADWMQWPWPTVAGGEKAGTTASKETT